MANVVEFEARASVERQAREWLIRLDADEPLTNTEKQALRDWTVRSPSHREDLIRISRFWNQANVLTELAVPLEPANRKGGRWVPFIMAAVIAFASIALAWWGVQLLDRGPNRIFVTAIGQQKSIALPDGSSIQLNTDSQVQVLYSDHARRVRLLRGEALFSVTPDPVRAFEVYAANSVIRAVGTAFAVQLAASQVDITVTKGVVELAEGANAEAGASSASSEKHPLSQSLARLEVGETTTLGNGGRHVEVHRLAEPELQRRLSWREGYLVFSGQTLSEVIEQMNRYSPVALEISEPQLASVPIGGRFRIGDLDAILDVLRDNFGIQSHRIDEHNIRLESGRHL